MDVVILVFYSVMQGFKKVKGYFFLPGTTAGCRCGWLPVTTGGGGWLPDTTGGGGWLVIISCGGGGFIPALVNACAVVKGLLMYSSISLILIYL